MGRIDKTKPSHWENNDTFILKIHNGSKYDGRFLILIKYVNDYIRYSNKKHLFRIKITKDDKIPKTLEDIEKAKYIKCCAINHLDRFYPFQGGESYEEMLKRCKHLIDLKPDKYNYLYSYLIYLTFSKNIEISNLQYIGNFKDESIKEYELVSSDLFLYIPHVKPINLCQKMVENYENYNLKKLYIFTKKGNKEKKEYSEYRWKFEMEAIENLQKLKNEKIKYDFPYSYGWGYKLYDSDESLDAKFLYEKAYNKEKTNVEVMNELITKGNDYLKDDTARPRFWMVVADLQMKNKRLDQKLKDFALIAIEDDLMFWKETEYYNQRKKELDKLKKKLEEYQCEN